MTTSKTEERLGYIKRSRTHFPWNFNVEISQPRRAALSNLGIKQDQVKKSKHAAVRAKTGSWERESVFCWVGHVNLSLFTWLHLQDNNCFSLCISTFCFTIDHPSLWVLLYTVKTHRHQTGLPISMPNKTYAWLYLNTNNYATTKKHRSRLRLNN